MALPYINTACQSVHRKHSHASLKTTGVLGPTFIHLSGSCKFLDSQVIYLHSLVLTGNHSHMTHTCTCTYIIMYKHVHVHTNTAPQLRTSLRHFQISNKEDQLPNAKHTITHENYTYWSISRFGRQL